VTLLLQEEEIRKEEVLPHRYLLLVRMTKPLLLLVNLLLVFLLVNLLLRTHLLRAPLPVMTALM
jgi:hypothetical protein